MCEKRMRKIKRAGSNITRLREARRVQRLQTMATPTPVEVPQTVPCPKPAVDKIAQNRVIIELAWKTIALMHKNRIIQQKIIALQKETSEFVASVMSSPENHRRYVEHIRLHRPNTNEIPIKMEPNI
ncbi:uncharacterized protein LOC121735780 [Aricia agestis]|uniref:uncharacterized protein LOC121735780 n=1 Tax=Aricia agestis TaxID=91739 RepID=UPI001C204246|nr:uncharacterized protein LOC121735780 [Aricia agestis]